MGIQSGEASSLPSEFCPTSDLRRQKKTFPAVNIRGGNFGRRTPKTLWLAPAPLNLLDTLEVCPNYRTSSMSLGPGQLEGCLVYRVDSMISQHSQLDLRRSAFAGEFDSEPCQMASPLSEQLTGVQPSACKPSLLSIYLVWSGPRDPGHEACSRVGAVSSTSLLLEIRQDAVLGGSSLSCFGISRMSTLLGPTLSS